MMTKVNLNAMDAGTIERAKKYALALVETARPLGPMAGSKFRGEVSSRAKWLLAALAKFEAEQAGEPIPGTVVVDPSPEEIAERAAKMRAKRAGKITAIHREQDEYRI